MKRQTSGVDELCSGFEAQTWKKDRCRKCFRLKEQHGVAAPRPQAFNQPSPTSVAPKQSAFTLVKPGDTNKTPLDPKKLPLEPKKAPLLDAKKIPLDSKKVITAGKPTTSSDVSATYILSTAPMKEKAISEDVNANRPAKRTKFVILKAEVSVDGTPAEEVSMETSIVTDSPSNSRPPSRRSLSPPDESYRSTVSSAADYITASSGYDPLSRATSWESVASTILDDKSMVTAGSGGAASERSFTPTEGMDASIVRSLKAQVEILENKCAELEKENGELRQIPTGRPATSESDRIKELRDKLSISETTVRDYKDENTVLKRDLRALQEAETKRVMPEAKALKSTLAAAEQLCEELMEENESLKKDVQGLQQEIGEMNDQYREDEIEEFRELQRELEQTAKNCRVLQFKLRKSERKCEQTEADRMHLDKKLKELLSNVNGMEPSDAPKIRELESELRIAKEVSVRLHNELEAVDEKRCKLEDENFYLRERVREIETREKLFEQSIAKQDQKKAASSAAAAKYVNGATSEYNNQQLLRDLKDALERETDLREQLKFAEEDISAARKKLADLEVENEGLVDQLTKLTSVDRGGSKHRAASMKRSYSEGHAQIELELAEHEAQVLKAKLDRIEKDNEQLLSKNDLLQKELKKLGGRTEFTAEETRKNAGVSDTYYKHKIKSLEDEINDWKMKFETIQKTEADQDTARRIGRQGKSRSTESAESKSDLDLMRKLELVEQEAGVMRLRISDLETENERLCGENRRLQLVRKQSNSKTDSSQSLFTETSANYANEKDPNKLRDKIEQMQKDIHKFINRIAELEKEKETLSVEMERRKKLDTIKKESTISAMATANKLNLQTASHSELRAKIEELLKENAILGSNLDVEQKRAMETDAQLADYKQVISQSENEKLITMASKVEVLTSQLKEAQKKVGKSQISEKQSINDNQAVNGKAPKGEIAMDEVKQHHVMNTVTDFLVKFSEQLNDLETQIPSPKPSPRLSRPARLAAGTNTAHTSSDNNEGFLKSLTTMKNDLGILKRKINEVQGQSGSNGKETSNVGQNLEQLNGKCRQQEQMITDLKEQLEVSKKERTSAYHECETATSRLLQTEERWSKEMEKTKNTFESQVKDLDARLKEAQKMADEKSTSLQERTLLLDSKSKRASELEAKTAKMEAELKTKHKDVQDKLDAERKKAKEFETKYQKLETLYENDRLKLSMEKEKFKQDLLELKKKYDDTHTDLDKLRNAQDKKEEMWKKEKAELETRVRSLNDEAKEVEKKVAKKVAESASAENRKLLSELGQLRKKIDTDAEEWKVERSNLQMSLDQKSKDLDFRLDELERMKKETNLMSSRIMDQKQQLEETRRMRDDAREELSKSQQMWTREKSEMVHKKRQDEKVLQAEQQSMQMKYESRMKILEESSKHVQAQLTQIRRERDQTKEVLTVTEKKMAEMKAKYESDEKGVAQNRTDVQKKGDMVENLKTQLAKEENDRKALQKNYDIDKRLWSVEREQFLNRIQDIENGNLTALRSGRLSSVRPATLARKDDKDKLLEQALQVGQEMKQQLAELKETYEKEIGTLQSQLEKVHNQSNKERSEMRRRIKDLQDNLKILDIDRRNVAIFKEDTEMDKYYLRDERDSLVDKLNDAEMHQLANKYKLDKVAEHLTNVQGKLTSSDKTSQQETVDLIKMALDQLIVVRDDMGKTRELGRADSSVDYEDSASLSSKRSAGTKRLADLLTIERETGESMFGKERFDALKNRSPRSRQKEELLSGSSDIGSLMRSPSSESSYEARLAELRLRSSSPIPRKITNYPDPPPSMIINMQQQGTLYDSDGKRHWTRRSQVKRSTSFDPTSSGMAPSDASDTEESKSTRSHVRAADSDVELNNRRSMVASSLVGSDDLSSTGSSPRARRKIIDIFGTFRKRRSKDRRKDFGGTKAHSIETSDVGHTLGAIAIQMFPPAVTPSTLPDSLQSSGLVDDRPKLAKSSSGSSIFAKFKHRSGSRDRDGHRQTSMDHGTGQSTPSGVYGSKTPSDENVMMAKDPKPGHSRPSTPSTSAFRRLTSSYRSLSAKYIHRL